MERNDFNRTPAFLIKDLWTAEQLPQGFRINRVEFSHLMLCGTIVYLERFPKNLKIILDDGTSTVACLLNSEQLPINDQLTYELGCFVRIFGKLNCGDYSRCIFIDKIELYNTIKQRQHYLETIIDLYENYY